MLAILHLLGTFVANLFRPRRRLEVENLFLRHQLNIALRGAPHPLRPRRARVGRQSNAREPCRVRTAFLKQHHSIKDSAQVTDSGAIISMITAVSTRPKKQYRSICSRIPRSIALAPHPPCEPAHIGCTLVSNRLATRRNKAVSRLLATGAQ